MELPSFDLFCRSLPLLIKGATLSLQILAISGFLSLCFGGIIGTLTCQRLRWRAVAPFLEVLSFVLRAVPFYVQLLIAYFVLPDVLNIQVDAFTASIASLSLCSSGYVAQVVRCGINSIA